MTSTAQRRPYADWLRLVRVAVRVTSDEQTAAIAAKAAELDAANPGGADPTKPFGAWHAAHEVTGCPCHCARCATA